MATIRQRRPGLWEVRVYLGRDPLTGKKRQRSQFVHGGKREAKAVASALEAEANRSGSPTTRQRTVAELLAAWYEHGEASWSLSTTQAYASRIKLISASSLGSARLDAVTTEVLDRWYSALHREGQTPANIRNHHALLRRAFGQAQRWGWLNSNPASLATPPRVPRRQMSAMTAEQVASAVDAAMAESLLGGLCLRLAAVTGLRRGELVGLQWGDLDGELLTISRSVTAIRSGADGRHPVRVSVGPTKTHAIRRLSLDVETTALIWRWHEHCRGVARELDATPGPWIVSIAPGNHEPCAPDWLTRVWAKARRSASIPTKWRLHDLRHWAATTLIARGEDVRLVAGRLGHARPATTLDVYAHFIERGDRGAAEILATELSGSAMSTIEADASELQ